MPMTFGEEFWESDVAKEEMIWASFDTDEKRLDYHRWEVRNADLILANMGDQADNAPQAFLEQRAIHVAEVARLEAKLGNIAEAVRAIKGELGTAPAGLHRSVKRRLADG